MSFLSHFAQSTNYSNIYNDSSSVSSVGFLIFMLLIFLAVLAVAYVVYSLLIACIFKKADIPQWIAWVPFYNTWKMLELGDQQGFWAVLAIVPLVNYVAAVFLYIAMYRIGLKFGKGSWFVVLAIFVPIVWYVWLALDSSKWSPKTVKL